MLGVNLFQPRSICFNLPASCHTEEASEILEGTSGVHQMSENERELHPSNKQQEIKRNLDENFHERVKKFIASKADLLFSMEGKKKLRRGIDYGMHSNQEGLDLYADTPPLETLMEVPLDVRRKQLFKCMKEGDIVVGKVAFKRPFCIIVTLTMLEFGCNRDFTDLDIQALCKLSELDSSEISKEYKDPTDAYVVGDVVRGVITAVNLQENRVSISLKQSRLPEEYKHLRLGVIEDPDSVFKRLQNNPEGLSFEEHINKHKGFNNPRSIDTLTDLLGVDTSAPCSLLRGFQRYECPESEYAEPLRRKQSAKWSMETTAKGVEHFKAGNNDTAMKYFKHALQIDGENVEALVAQGALCANQGQLSAAIKDFRKALAICPNHRNAKKYLTATLVEQGIQQEKEGLLNEAVKSLTEALGLDHNQQTAKENLERLQQQLKRNEQKAQAAAAMTDKGLKSRFSHVRELILEEQSQAKKKQKKKNRKKRKLKHLKKKKKKSTGKILRRSKRSSSSSRSSSESSSESESSIQSSDSDEWVENTVVAQNDTKKGRQQGNHSKQDRRHHRHQESHIHTDASHKETNRRGRKRTESPTENDRKKGDIGTPTRGRVRREKRRMSSSRSSSSRSPSVCRDREKDRERVRRERNRERVSHDINRSPVERKTGDWASYKRDSEDVSKRMHSSQKDSVALTSFQENSLESVLKRIREDSGKDVGDRTRKKDASLTSTIDNVSDDRSSEKLRIRGTERSSARHFKECALSNDEHSKDVLVSKSEAEYIKAGHALETSKSLGLRDQTSGSARDRKPSLVSYEDSSDEEKS